jgi:hypothetical protein
MLMLTALLTFTMKRVPTATMAQRRTAGTETKRRDKAAAPSLLRFA